MKCRWLRLVKRKAVKQMSRADRVVNGFCWFSVGMCVGVAMCVGSVLKHRVTDGREEREEVEVRAVVDLPRTMRESVGVWTVTAYCPCSRCCGAFADGITASGVAARGKLVAAPKELPFGTVLDVPGYGVASVEDRGGAIKGRKLDVLFATHNEALQWGVKELEIYKISK